MSVLLALALLVGQVGSATEEGVATWCAPTPTHCQSWGGNAKLGAVSGYAGDPYTVVVHHGSRSVVVTVVSSCACGMRHGKDTVIDLSPAAFRQLAPLSLGVIDVVVERADGISLPPTDVVWWSWPGGGPR